MHLNVNICKYFPKAACKRALFGSRQRTLNIDNNTLLSPRTSTISFTCAGNRYVCLGSKTIRCYHSRSNCLNSSRKTVMCKTNNTGLMQPCEQSLMKLIQRQSQRCHKLLYLRSNQSLASNVSSIEHLKPTPVEICGDASDEETKQIMSEGFLLYENFVTEAEEKSLFEELEPYLKRLRYEYNHWDDAIHGYRETERKHWSEKNKPLIQRVRDLAFPPGAPHLAFVHVLDIEKQGYVKAHVDSVRFCGDVIAGICLRSSAVMRVVHVENKDSHADILMKRRSLYVMKNRVRYEYTHEVLGEEQSKFKGQIIPRDRRISVICRCEPNKENT